MSAKARFFCAAQSRKNNESIYGTASRTRSWVLLEYPGAWRPSAIAESDLPVDLQVKLSRLGSGGRSLLIRQSHEASKRIACFAANARENDPELHRIDFEGYGALHDLAMDALPKLPQAQRVEKPVFLVCTHGSHDKCCAKFGLPIFEAFKYRVGADAWQCTHVGGDRFAANVVCFPYGIYYGHVGCQDVDKIVEAHGRGEVYLKNYRGRSCYPRNVQVAEYFARAESGRLGLDDFRLLRAEGTTVRFQANDGVHEVEYRPKDGPCEFLTCKSEASHPVIQYELIRHEVVERTASNAAIQDSI